MTDYCSLSGKQGFPTVGHASNALKRLRNKGHPYLCKHCKSFHITQKGNFETKLHKTNKHSLQYTKAKELLDDNSES